MIYNVYAIRDALSGFMSPTLESSDALALRHFSMAVSNAQAGNLMHFRPGDFNLYRIGKYNTDDGAIIRVDPITLVASGDSIMDREEV